MIAQPFDFSTGVNDEQRNKTLQELTGHDWGEPAVPSYLVRTCHALRRKPLREFTVEDLRIMIGQNISLNYLMPLAIEQLQHDPLVAGDFYPGDLLAAVLAVETDFWRAQPQLRRTVQEVVDRLAMLPERLQDALLAFQRL